MPIFRFYSKTFLRATTKLVGGRGGRDICPGLTFYLFNNLLFYVISSLRDIVWKKNSLHRDKITWKKNNKIFSG